MYHSASSAITPKSQPVLICPDRKIQGCKSLKVAQDPSGHLSIWFTTTKDELGYIRTNLESLSSGVLPKPELLLPSGEATFIAPLITGPSTVEGDVWQILIAGDNKGSLTLLEQASDLGLWRQKPFYSHDDESLYEVPSYSVTIRALDETGAPVRDGSVEMTAASGVTGQLNGEQVTLGQFSDWYATDFEGVLNLIIPTESIASQTLTITALKDSNGQRLNTSSMVFDPSKKVVDRLNDKIDDIASIEQLKEQKTQSGELLFDTSDMPSDEDLTNGLGCLRELRKAHKELSENGDLKYNDIPITALRAAPAAPAALDPLGLVMDAWNWIKHKISEAAVWIVKKTG
jgi:hypothetical protein